MGELCEIKSLNLLESVIQLIKKDKDVAAVLQKTVAITKAAKSPKKDAVCDILSEVLENLKLCNNDTELSNFQMQLRTCFLPKELRPLAIDITHYTIKMGPSLLGLPMPSIIGQGSCGMVVMGTMIKGNSKVDVAIKKPHILTPAMLKLSTNEAQAMVNLKHGNIVAILGYQKANGDILMEDMALGDLKNAMQQITFSKNNMLDFIIEICKGMEFIDSKKYIHRSLKIDNILLNDKRQLKIGDFGFAQYVGKTDGVYIETEQRNGFHIAPESFKTKKFRIQSDIYSMGLLIWDMFYELKKDEKHRDFLNFLQQTHEPAGLRMPRPPKCPKVVFNYVKDSCLNTDFKRRPTFEDIRKKILSILIENQTE